MDIWVIEVRRKPPVKDDFTVCLHLPIFDDGHYAEKYAAQRQIDQPASEYRAAKYVPAEGDE